MRVVLVRVRADPSIGVHPRELDPPVILLYAATLLRSSGHDVVLYDLDWRGLGGWPRLGVEPADLFVIEADAVAFDAARYIAETLKERFGNGVALYSLAPTDEALRFIRGGSGIDYLVTGDPERQILGLVKCIATESAFPESVYRRGESDIKRDGFYIERDLDSLPFPDQALLPRLRYSKRKFGQPKMQGPWRFLLFTRGCPYSCRFCASAHRSSFGRLFRSHSPEYVLNLITHYRESFGLGAISFEDDVFTLNRERVVELCDGMKSRGLAFPWVAQTRPDLLDRELLSAMRSAGCFGLALGVEALDDELLTSLNKGFASEQVSKTLGLCREAGVSVLVNIMVGLPSQSPDAFVRGAKALFRHMRRAHLHIHKFNPTGCYDKGDWLNAARMSDEQAGRLQSWAYRRFYLRPRSLIFQLASRGRSFLFDSDERKLLWSLLRYSFFPNKRRFGASGR